MSTVIASTDVGTVIPGRLYTLERAKELTGLGSSAFREARRNGLGVVYFGRRAFVSGDELIRHILENGRGEK